MRQNLKYDKGVAGLNVLLSVIIMLFVIGFLVMIFALIGSSLENEVLDENTVGSTDLSTVTLSVVNEAGAYLTGTRDIGANCKLTVITAVNSTSNETIDPGNFTTSTDARGCRIVYTSTDANDTARFNNSIWNVSSTFVYDANNSASNVIADATGELGEVTDWFGIIIVITAMVVLILLTIIIITAIKSSGLIAGDSGGIGRETA